MIKKRIFYLLVLVIIVSFFNFTGINWGIPEKNRIFLVFGDESKIENLSELMRDTHQEIQEMLVFYGAPYSKEYNPTEKIEIKIDSRKLITSLEIINSMRSYLIRSYGADEQAVLASLSKMNPSRLDFNPHFFEYGGAYLYPIGIFLKICDFFGIVELKNDITYYFKNPEKIGQLYTISRFFGGLVFLFSVIVFYFLAFYILKDENTSFLMAVLFGITPVFVIWSHYLKPYCYGILWVICAMYFALRFMDEKRLKWFIFTSLFSGLAMGSILSYGYFFITLIFLIFLISFSFKDLFRYILISLGCFFFYYFLTNPYVLISFKEFINEISYIQSYWRDSFNFDNLRYFAVTSFRYGLGTGIWLIFLISLLVCFLFKPDRKFLFVFLSILPGFVYFGISTGKWVHYAFIVYPYIFVIIIFGMLRIRKQFSKVIILAGILWTFIFSISYVGLFYGENIRSSAGRWINDNIPEGSKIGLLEAPSPWRTPPFQFLKYNIIIGASKETEYFIVSEYQWVRGSSLEDIKQLLFDYEIIREFRKEQKFLGFTFRYPEFIPYDWCHPNPTILIWKRKSL